MSEPRFDGTDNVLDRSDIEARIEWIESEKDEGGSGPDGLDEREEYEALLELRDAMGDYLDMLILDSYFEFYAEQYARDVHGDDVFDSWPGYYIDWKRAADNLLLDYTELDFMGSTYYAR